MGIVNITPDSFSDGGDFLNPDKAFAHACKMVEEGADILDLGGESTRPNALPVTLEEEQNRVLPVLNKIRNHYPDLPISVDTRNPQIMAKAMQLGATMLNDVSGFRSSDALSVVQEFTPHICIMHMQGDPQSMQLKPHYNNVIEDILHFLDERVEGCMDCGLVKEKILIDPGIGFGKDENHTHQILHNLERFGLLGCYTLLGASRKSFIPKLLRRDIDTQARLPGSLATVLWGLQKGVKVFRVHDVAQTKQALDLWQLMSRPEWPESDPLKEQ